MVEAARAELEATPDAAVAVDLGPARPDLSTGPALDTRYRVDLRGVRVGLEALRDLALAPAGEPGRRLPVVEVVARSGDTLTVVAPANRDDLHLFATVDPSAPLRALVAALEAAEEPGLAERFDSRLLDRPPPATRQRPGLSAEEAAAWTASCAPGFNVVWAPAGTDSARVVAEVAAALAGAGHSVLLVSAAGASVDRAALETARLLGAAEQGQVIRVGPPSLPEVADHPFLRLERASERRASSELARLAEIERRAAALRAEPDQLLLERAERLLAGFDQAGYERARRLVENADALDALGDQLDRQERELGATKAEREQARAAFDEADAAVAEVRQARAAYQEIDRLERQLGSLREQLDEAKDHIRQLMHRLEESRDAVADYGRLSPVRKATHLGTGGRVRAAQRDAEAALLPAWEVVVEREREAGVLRERVEAEERRAGPFGRDEIDRRDQARASARERLEAAGTAEHTQERALRTLRRDLERARQAPAPDEADRRLVSTAEEEGLPELAGRLDQLRAAAGPGSGELAALAAERERLTAATAALGPDTVAEAVVVATTLDRMAADPAVRRRGYDHVLVDDAAAALPPAVVLAATLAGRGVTLVGDPLQSGPASAQQSSKQIAVARWLLRDSFGALGLDRPEQLTARPGCSTLAPVRRLGPDTTELANRVAYAGHLRLAAGADRPRPPDDGLGELVLVDVSRHGDLARARTGHRSGQREWWPVGALLAAAIAGHHDAPGKAAALMAPHAAQQRLTEAALRDAGLGERVQAGTPARFGGQSFHLAVLDLVEDGREPGWLARGRLDGTRHELRGLRLFDTGVTRAARTYLLAHAAAVERAQDGPLRHVGDLCREGRINVVDAGRFLPVALRHEPGASAPAAALLALERDALYHRLEAELAAASDEVWVWSPLLSARPTQVLTWLRAAAGRGCRVTVFVKPSHEHRPNDERRLAGLRDAGMEVVEIYGVIERLLVIDRRRCFLGNVSVLATPRERDEEMVVLEGEQVVRALLALEQAEAFRAAPPCPRHPPARCYAQYYRRGRERGWFWTCPWCGERQPVALRD